MLPQKEHHGRDQAAQTFHALFVSEALLLHQMWSGREKHLSQSDLQLNRRILFFFGFWLPRPPGAPGETVTFRHRPFVETTLFTFEKYLFFFCCVKSCFSFSATAESSAGRRILLWFLCWLHGM